MLPWTIWYSHSMWMQKYTVSKLNHLKIDLWPNFLACQPKSVLWHHTVIDLLFQFFKLQLQKMGPACLYRSTSRKTFPLSTREIMTCLCNTFLKTFFRTQVMSLRLLCWLSKQCFFFPDHTICNTKSTFPNLISPMQDLEMISGKYTNETVFFREQHSRNNLMFLYLLAWCTSNLFKQGFCQTSKKTLMQSKACSQRELMLSWNQCKSLSYSNKKTVKRGPFLFQLQIDPLR